MQKMNLPNRLTLIRTAMVPLFVACFYLNKAISWWNLLAAAIFFLADMTDIADGYIARTQNLVTNFGKLMDPMADKLLFCSAFIMLTWKGMLSPLFCLLFVGREFVIAGFRLVTASSGTIIAANWLGKLKATLQVIAVLWTLLDNPIFRIWNIPFDLIMMYASAVTTIWSAVDYVVRNRSAVRWD